MLKCSYFFSKSLLAGDILTFSQTTTHRAAVHLLVRALPVWTPLEWFSGVIDELDSHTCCSTLTLNRPEFGLILHTGYFSKPCSNLDGTNLMNLREAPPLASLWKLRVHMLQVFLSIYWLFLSVFDHSFSIFSSQWLCCMFKESVLRSGERLVCFIYSMSRSYSAQHVSFLAFWKTVLSINMVHWPQQCMLQSGHKMQLYWCDPLLYF